MVTARTQARDLLWWFDSVRRLSDAQAKAGVQGPAEYVDPGALWWAFDRASARTRGGGGITPPVEQEQRSDDPKAVVLIDEIDKADPDIPNSLLVALGSMRFTVEETGFEVRATPETAPFVVITTNDERELPKAFVRRCATLTLGAPDRDRLLKIAKAQFPDGNRKLDADIADIVLALGAGADGPVPSTAEYIDAIRACIDLEVTPTSDEWEDIRRILLTKRVNPQVAASPSAANV